MYDFCQHKDALGKPNEGVHASRTPVLDLAFNDVFMTIIAGIIIATLFGFNKKNTVIVLFLLGILLHRLFCVRTTVDKFLFS
jgi:uncharacterized membrane protein